MQMWKLNLTLENETHGPKTASVFVEASTPAAALSRGFKLAKKELKGVHWSSATVPIVTGKQIGRAHV